ncbi:hypothetical protein PCE1_000100 [Barthelona sp. PCE]
MSQPDGNPKFPVTKVAENQGASKNRWATFGRDFAKNRPSFVKRFNPESSQTALYPKYRTYSDLARLESDGLVQKSPAFSMNTNMDTSELLHTSFMSDSVSQSQPDTLSNSNFELMTSEVDSSILRTSPIEAVRPRIVERIVETEEVEQEEEVDERQEDISVSSVLPFEAPEKILERIHVAMKKNQSPVKSKKKNIVLPFPNLPMHTSIKQRPLLFEELPSVSITQPFSSILDESGMPPISAIEEHKDAGPVTSNIPARHVTITEEQSPFSRVDQDKKNITKSILNSTVRNLSTDIAAADNSPMLGTSFIDNVHEEPVTSFVDALPDLPDDMESTVPLIPEDTPTVHAVEEERSVLEYESEIEEEVEPVESDDEQTETDIEDTVELVRPTRRPGREKRYVESAQKVKRRKKSTPRYNDDFLDDFDDDDLISEEDNEQTEPGLEDEFMDRFNFNALDYEQHDVDEEFFSDDPNDKDYKFEGNESDLEIEYIREKLNRHGGLRDRARHFREMRKEQANENPTFNDRFEEFVEEELEAEKKKQRKKIAKTPKIATMYDQSQGIWDDVENICPTKELQFVPTPKTGGSTADVFQQGSFDVRVLKLGVDERTKALRTASDIVAFVMYGEALFYIKNSGSDESTTQHAKQNSAIFVLKDNVYCIENPHDKRVCKILMFRPVVRK